MSNATAVPAVRPAGGWLVANVVSQLAFGLLAMTVCLPSMQDWPVVFGASQAAVQLTFSGYVATYGGMQLLYGPISDRVGRRPVLMFGLALAALASVLAALAPSLELLVAARVLQGAGAAAGMVMGRALVQDLFQGPERTRMMAFVGMAMGFCPPLATILGGNVHVAWGWQGNFVLVALLAAVLFVAAWRGLPAGRPPGATSAGGWRQLVGGYATLLRTPAFLLFALICSTTTATFYTFLSGAPIVLGGYGVTPERMGWYIMCIPFSYALGNWLTSRLIHRHGERRMMMAGQLATLAGPALVLVLGLAGVHTPLALALPLVLLGIGHGFLVPPSLAGTVGLIPALAGSAAALAGLSQQLTGSLAGYVVGLVPHHGPVNLAVLMLAWTVLGFAAQFVLHHGVDRRAR